MFLKDIVQTRASSGPIAPSIETKLEPLDDTGPVDDVDIDATSQYSQDSSNQSEETMAIPGGIQDSLTDETPQCSHGAGSFFQNPVSSKRKRQCQDEDYYSRLCSIEEKKLELMLDRIIRKKSDADREDKDLMFLKALLPHVRKIP